MLPHPTLQQYPIDLNKPTEKEKAVRCTKLRAMLLLSHHHLTNYVRISVQDGGGSMGITLEKICGLFLNCENNENFVEATCVICSPYLRYSYKDV